MYSRTTVVDSANLTGIFGLNSISGKFLLKDLKVEYGTKATDWTPAPEDTLLKGTNGRYNLGTATYYADNAAAITGGLAIGDMYVTPTGENRTVV